MLYKTASRITLNKIASLLSFGTKSVENVPEIADKLNETYHKGLSLGKKMGIDEAKRNNGMNIAKGAIAGASLTAGAGYGAKKYEDHKQTQKDLNRYKRTLKQINPPLGSLN